MLDQGLYRKGESGDLEKAKDEMSFCFKSSRSSFKINMWEIDNMVKKGRCKTPGLTWNKRDHKVNLAESSRKFITCYLSTLERPYISIRADKRFSLCLEDLVPLVLGRYIKALVFSINQADVDRNTDDIALKHLLEKKISFYLEHMNLWSDICSFPVIKCPDLSESGLFGSYLQLYFNVLHLKLRGLYLCFKFRGK